jgi:hypothetical protein
MNAVTLPSPARSLRTVRLILEKSNIGTVCKTNLFVENIPGQKNEENVDFCGFAKIVQKRKKLSPKYFLKSASKMEEEKIG